MSRTETHTPTRPRRRTSLKLAIAATILLLTVGVSAAAATSTVEGVWSFKGGQIAVQPAGNGKLVGIVVSPITFATCAHPVGQEIWTGITAQSDGSYQGFHQWYFETASCALNPTLGPTAWRVLEKSDGSRSLLVCLSEPGGPQPTIPAGSTTGIGQNYGCQESALTAPLASSGVGTFKEVVKLPSASKCLSGRKFQIHVRDTKLDPFKSVVVTLKGRKLKISHRGSTYTATVNLKGLTHGAFTIKIKATTVRGHHVSGSRTYHTCAQSAKKSKPKKLH